MIPVPRVPFPEVAARVQQRIVRPPGSNPHQVFLGQTRSGKDALIRWGLLPLFPLARILVLVTKHGGFDETWDGWGNLIAPGELPADFGLGPDGTPRYQISLTPGKVTSDEAKQLLNQCAKVGEMILVIGDAAALTDPPDRGGLGCEAFLTHMMAEGAGIGLSIFACANSAAWAASGIKDQAASVWVGRSGGKMQDPFADIAGLPRRNVELGRGAERDAIATLKRHWWLYTDHEDGELFAGITTPPPPGWYDESWPPGPIEWPHEL